VSSGQAPPGELAVSSGQAPPGELAVSSGQAPPGELAWFAALCDDDTTALGDPSASLPSSWAHCRDITIAAERAGFDSILLPSGYALGIDAVTFAAAVATVTQRIRLLVAVRVGEMWPPQLARQLASLAEIVGTRPDGAGRLLVNIISSDLPGITMESGARYERTAETMAVLRSLLAGLPIDHHGAHLDLTLDPPRLAAETRPAPPLYFGGLSEPARQAAAEQADVYLMWPDTQEVVAEIIDDMTCRAAAHGRTLRFGYRVHVVVRETDDEARSAADDLVAAVTAPAGDAIRNRSLDARSVGVARQAELRGNADADGFVEEHLWTGIGRARSGCGAAIVGDPGQVASKISAYVDMGIESFILSGYPHAEEAERFGRLVMPLLRS